MTTIHVELPDDLVALLRESGRPVEVVAREMIIVGLYHRGALAGDRVAELLATDRLPKGRTDDDAGAPLASLPSRSVD